MNQALAATLEFLVIAGLVAANGFFVAAEFALVKVRASQLRPLVKKGPASWRLRMALRATQHLDAALSASQLGITLTSLGLGWVGEPFFARRLEPLLAHFNITEPAVVTSLSFGVAFISITFLHIVFGEQAPKMLAIQRAKPITLWVSGPLMVFHYLFFPFIWLLNNSANGLIRWSGFSVVGEGEAGFSSEELEYVFSQARHSHPGDALINKLMVQSLRARKTQAQMIMRPRDQVVALWLDRPISENLRTAQTSGHSRFPVCSGDLDHVVGILLVREWLWQISMLGTDTPFAPLVRHVVKFGLTTPLHAMIEEFRTSRSHLAVVLDADQRLAGIVTLEDCLEEIVGDIRDEFDIERGPIFEHTPLSIVVAGSLTMRELQAETGWPFEWQPRETVATWSIRQFGRVPKRGDAVTAGEYRVTVTEATTERPRRVKVERFGMPV